MDRTANYLNLIAIISLSGVITTACNDSFMKSSIRNKTSGLAALSTTIDEAGNITATIDPNATTTQIMRFDSGALAGSAIAIPPGSLSIPVEITVGQGPTLSSADFLAEIGLTNNTVTAAGPSVSFIPSSNVEASNPFTLSLPLSVTSLALTENSDNLVVMYHWSKVVNGEVTFVKGVIPGEEVVISNSKVTFQTTKFGTFQLARAEIPITTRVSATTSEGTGTIANAKVPLLGDWGMCVARQPDTEPTYSKPTWGHIQTLAMTDGTEIHSTLRGKDTNLEIKKYPTSDCSGSAETLENYGFVGIDFFTTQVGSYKIFDKSNSTQTSACLPVYKQPSRLPYIDITSVERFNRSGGSPSIMVNWSSSETPVDLLVYNAGDCSGTPTISSNSYTSGDAIDIDSTHLSTPLWVRLKASNASQPVSACVPVPVIIQPVAGGISMESFVQSLTATSHVSWHKSVDPTVQYSYKVIAYDAPGCTPPPYKEFNRGNSLDVDFYFSDKEPPMLSFKIEGTSSATSSQTIYSACHNILPFMNKPSFTIRGYSAGANWARLEWNLFGVKNEELELTQYDGINCSSNPKSLSLTSDAWGDAWGGSKHINNLAPLKNYSFKLALIRDSSSFYCQNVSTTEADMPDWSFGNSSSEVGLTNDLPLIAKPTVTDGKTDYKLKISINGMSPEEKYSVNIPTGTNTATTLARIPKLDAENKIITAIAPDGCYFSSSPGKRDRALFISTYATASANEVICDGSMSDGGGGGGDSFGAPPNTVKSKQMRLGIISGGKVTFSEELFASDNCAVGTKLSQMIEDGSATFTSDAGTFPIDVSFNRKEGLIFTDAGVTAANTYPDQFGCGLKNWTRGTKQNLTESSCGNDKRTEYLRFKVSDDNQLLFTCDPSIMNNSVYGKTPEMRFPGCDTAKSPTFKRLGR